MFTFLLKCLAIACGIGLILILPILFANIQHQPATPTNETSTVKTPRNTTERPRFIKAPDAEVPFQEAEFYRTIIDNNLFRPLGWRPTPPRDSFQLLGTRIPTDERTSPQAIIQATTKSKTYILTPGDALSKDTTLIEIQPKQVTLEKAGHRRTLKLSTTLWLR